MRPGYHHVMAMFYDPDGDAWLVLDPIFGGLQCRALTDSPSLTVQLLAAYPCTAWAMVRLDRHAYPVCTRGPLTCVSVVKALLGLRGWSLTPYQLYRQIEALGWPVGLGPDGQAGGARDGQAAQEA